MRNPKKCKYHCDYGDGENCHYEGEGDCIYIKGRRLTNTESMGMLFDDPPTIEYKKGHWILKGYGIGVCSECDFCVGNVYVSKYCPNCGAKMEVGTY